MRRIGCLALIVFEIALLSALILVTRCANYQDVFVAGNIYFTDADCYARMTRVRICAQQPGLIVRHQAFENSPDGTSPHTTAPLDYLILGLSVLLKPFTPRAVDLAGAFISPLLALLGSWFLWWWSWQMRFRYRWTLLILYAVSPILVHGTQLGRPDHQSLLMLLVAIGICAEWILQNARAENTATAWSVVGASAWALAIWVSAYEPLVLFVLVIVLLLLFDRGRAPQSGAAAARSLRVGWIVFAAILLIALLIERRMPSFSSLYSDPSSGNWARTIGELTHVSPANPVWLRWCGYFLLISPFLIWISVRARRDGGPGRRAVPIYVLLLATYLLTIWQARWAYFFVLMFALAVPALLEPIKSRAAVWIAFVLSMFPISRDWDETLWPNESQLAACMERRLESAQVRELALTLQSSQVNPFLAPWWLSPSIAYWSGQPGVAGSSHESLKGIEDSARFFLAEDPQEAREILANHRVTSVFAYDSQRVAENSAAILNRAVPARPLCEILDRTPSQAPQFLILSAQNAAAKLYRNAVER